MAKATAHCTCEICGAKFEKEKRNFQNRKSANEWEEWAEHNFTICPACSKKKWVEEQKAKGLVVSVRMRSPYEDRQNCCALIFSGDTYPYKDKLKEMGANYTTDYPSESSQFGGGILGAFVASRPSWVISCTIDEVDNYLEKIKAIGGHVEEMVDEMQIYMWLVNKAAYEKEKEAENEEKKKKLESLGPLPSWPDELLSLWPDGAKWNRTFYGKKGRWRIYLSGEEIHISDELKEEMERIHIQRIKWSEKKEEIEKQYK